MADDTQSSAGAEDKTTTDETPKADAKESKAKTSKTTKKTTKKVAPKKAPVVDDDDDDFEDPFDFEDDEDDDEIDLDDVPMLGPADDPEDISTVPGFNAKSDKNRRRFMQVSTVSASRRMTNGVPDPDGEEMLVKVRPKDPPEPLPAWLWHQLDKRGRQRLAKGGALERRRVPEDDFS